MTGITYDTGALLAAEANNRGIWVFHERALLRGRRPVIPAVVFAQAWRGGPQPLISRLRKGCVIESFDENRSRTVGRVLARSGTCDVVDAAVVVGALERGDLVVTSDPNDLRRLADSVGRALGLYVVQ